MSHILTEPRRRALYALGTSVGALAVAYGIASDQQATLWVGAAHALVSLIAGVHVGAPPATSE